MTATPGQQLLAEDRRWWWRKAAKRLNLGFPKASFLSGAQVIVALFAALRSNFAMNVIRTGAFGRNAASSPHDRTAFHRTELSVIMNVYSRMVAAGEWRDYSMDFLKDVAIFSVFRRATEHPLYRIEKRPKNAAKQGAYAVLGHDGRLLKRGRDLKSVMRVFDSKLIRAVD